MGAADRGASIDFYFDFSCPYAYIGATQIEALARRANATLRWKPMLLGGVFRATGAADSPMSAMSPAKARHNALDMMRWARHYEVPLHVPAAHPMRTVEALRVLLALGRIRGEAAWPPAIHALYAAYWQRGEDITRADVIGTTLRNAGVAASDVDAALAARGEQPIKDELRARTDEAIGRGVFGAPTMFVDAGDGAAEMFWGQDRLAQVETHLGGTPPEPASTVPDGQRVVRFYYDFSSPFAYLGSTQIEALAERTGATLEWRPMLLGAVFKQLGTPNVPLLAFGEAKRRYFSGELARWAREWQVPFRFTSRFPMKTVTALRLALLAGERIATLSHALFRALWVDDRDISDESVLAEILAAEGFDADAMLARSREPASKQALFAATDEAVAAGVFGAPTCVVERDGAEPELYWGQDRLQLVESALRR